MTEHAPEAPAGRDTLFGDRLVAAVTARESQVVLGIDPEPMRLWPDAVSRASEARAALVHALAEAERAAARTMARAPTRTGPGSPTPSPTGTDLAAPGEAPAGDVQGPLAAAGAESPAGGAAARGRLEAAAAVLAHSLALVDAAGPACVAVKPQLAFFEQLGFGGWLALEAVCDHARARGLLVLADGKRGDVPSTATAYARALAGAASTPFGPAPGLRADAFTANPLLGRDALAPLVDGARAAGAGAFLLVRTSNPGAADLLDLPLASGEPLWERLAALVAALGRTGASGLADVGAVTGATAPEHLERMRSLMPAAPFLLPGVGAQGGDVRSLAAAFAPGRAAGLVTASRSIANAHEQASGSPADAARAEAERLREVAWGLA